jgi:choline dehydrogenase
VFDYIIVGAGSAGCVLASRLTDDPNVKVLLLEAGPPDKNIWLKVPAGLSRVFADPEVNWCYTTRPEPHLNDRRIFWPKGKTLGGSSAINGLAYIRGNPLDYDNWQQMGNSGWGWDDIYPHFLKSECNADIANHFHGQDGEMGVSNPLFRHPSSQAFVDSAMATGIRSNEDHNGLEQEGVGFLQFTMRNGVRESTASAFLKPVLSRTNLRIETSALSEKLIFEDRRCVGVRYSRQGESLEARANAEVIVCGGSVASPQLLMLSGIGSGAELQSKDIRLVHDLPGVGKNLHDHLYIHYLAETTRPWSLNNQIRGLGVIPHALRYFLTHKGVLTMAASQACAFIKGLPGASRPDLQINFRPVSTIINDDGRIVADSLPGVTASVCHLQPQSRGEITLASPDPSVAPNIQANYLESALDQQAMVAGIRWIRRIFASLPLAEIVVKEREPGKHLTSSEDIIEFVRENAQSMYHPVGTCRMGQDEMAVVDEELRVRGVEGLRVADASVMPVITSGNTNAPVIMIGEKAADLIKQTPARPGKA